MNTLVRPNLFFALSLVTASLSVVGCGRVDDLPAVRDEVDDTSPVGSLAPPDDAGVVWLADPDAGAPGSADDAGALVDAGGHDAGPIDAGPIDAGSADAGASDDDGGSIDAGRADAGRADAGGEPPSVVDAGAEPSEPDAGPHTHDDAGAPGGEDAGVVVTAASCLEHLLAGATADGPYLVDPDQDGSAERVWCDMTTDGGGWTLVAATRGVTLNDERSSYYDDLARPDPEDAHTGLWDGLRALIATNSDLRVSCKVDATMTEPIYDVDLSFYDVGWYREVTEGSDADACFEEGNGAGYTGPWARRNNLTGAYKDESDDYDHGYQGFPPHFEGEDSCGDDGDFAVDFDDRGMDSVPFDGTDWGEDDHGRKCGSVSPSDGSWFVWVRERH